MTDVWPVAGHGCGHTISSDNPNARIDYIFGSQTAVTAHSAEVRHVNPAASDHLMVAATVGIA